MCAEGAGGSCVGKIEVEVENVLCLHGALLVELLNDKAHQEVASLKLTCDLTKNRQHVLLSAQLHAVVHLAVEVDGEVADLQQRSLDVEEHG